MRRLPFLGSDSKRMLEAIHVACGGDSGQWTPSQAVAATESAEALALITGLLSIDARRRLTTSDLMAHPFFLGTPWGGMRGVEPPFVPDLSGANLASYFPEALQGGEANAASFCESLPDEHAWSGPSCSDNESKCSDQAVASDGSSFNEYTLSFTGVRGMHVNNLVEFSRTASSSSSSVINAISSRLGKDVTDGSGDK